MSRRTERRARLAQMVRLAHEPSLTAIAPQTVAEILAHEAAKPMRAGDAELSHDSLFGDAHKQVELFA